MQRNMDLFATARENFGLIINTEKTVVMHQPPPDAVYIAPQTNVNGARLQAGDNFTYLGSTLSRNTKIDDEVARLISKMYKTAILSTLLYEAVTLTVYKKQTHRLNHFHFSCLRRILRLSWQDRIPDSDVLERTGTQIQPPLPQLSSTEIKAKSANRVPNTDVLERTGILSIYVMLRQLQTRWSGHLVRMDNERLPNLFFMEKSLRVPADKVVKSGATNIL
ncbi:hypothetical protein SprV_0100112900 [Sparganum proliferum]